MKEIVSRSQNVGLGCEDRGGVIEGGIVDDSYWVSRIIILIFSYGKRNFVMGNCSVFATSTWCWRAGKGTMMRAR